MSEKRTPDEVSEKRTPDEVIALTRQYIAELDALFARMEQDGERMTNRGSWHTAAWFLHTNVRDLLVQFIGEQVLRLSIPEET